MIGFDRSALALVVAFSTLSMFVRTSNAEMGPAVDSDKKVIGWGTDTVDAIYLSENIALLERTRPMDGIVISLYPDDWTEIRRHRNSNWFGAVKYTMADFKQGVARIQRCQFTRYTDNFIDLATSIRSKRLAEWFDEDWEDVVAGNSVVAAKIARDVGFKGLFIDTEAYGYGQGVWRSPFSYRTYAEQCTTDGEKPRSLESCRAQVRKCGRILAEAITDVYPDIVLFFIAGLGANAEAQQLRIPFIDGVLEGAGPQVMVYDGGEQGYPRMTYSSFRRLRSDAANMGESASENHGLFRKRVRFDFGVWVDCRPETYGGFHTNDLSKNHKDGLGFEHTLYNALTVSDKYVWHPELWWTPTKGKGKQCRLCPHDAVPKPYLNALVSCRTAHDLDWTPLRKDDRTYPRAEAWPGYDHRATFAEADKQYDLIMDLSEHPWRFCLDAELPFGYADLIVDEALFKPIRIGAFWEHQGYPFDGIGWYRLWVKVPEAIQGKPLTGRKFFLVYGGVAGSTCTWIWRRQVDDNDGIGGYLHGIEGICKHGGKWNKVELGRQSLDDFEQNTMTESFERDVSMIVRPGHEHLFIVRVHNTKGAGGIWRSIRLYAAK